MSYLKVKKCDFYIILLIQFISDSINYDNKHGL